MEQIDFILDLVLAVTAALIGGAIAQRLRQPALVGYLLAGVVIGVTNPIHARPLADVPVLGEIGVALLLFVLGLEFNPRRLRPIRDVAIFGGIAQILVTAALAAAIALAVGVSLPASLFFGSLIAISSTVVVFKTLGERGELDALHAQIAIGLLIVQDISVVPMMIVLPELADPGEALVIALLTAIGRAAIVLILTYLIGTRLVPATLRWVAGTGSRELFLLAIITLALGTALLTQLFGLSLAFGAFLAGFVVAESEFSYQATGEVGPIRDLFAALFFVSVGKLIDPRYLIDNWAIVVATVAAIVIGKAIIGTLVPLVFGYPFRAALATGLAIAQIGEFSFVLARVGLDRGVLDDQLYALVLAASLVTLLLSPFVGGATDRLYRLILAVPGAEPWLEGRGTRTIDRPDESIANHVIICGFGRVGRELADALERRGFRFVVIEFNPHGARAARQRGLPAIYGNCANPAVLEQAGIARARVIAIAVPDAVTAAETTRRAKRLNPRIDIVARSHSVEEMERLREAGAEEAVLPEFEAGLEFVRHTLRRYGVSGQEIQSIISARRAANYRR